MEVLNKFCRIGIQVCCFDKQQCLLLGSGLDNNLHLVELHLFVLHLHEDVKPLRLHLIALGTCLILLRPDVL